MHLSGLTKIMLSLLAVLPAVGLHAQDLQPVAKVIWTDPCEQDKPWRTIDPYTQLQIDSGQLEHTQGEASLKITCPRKPGMLDDKQFKGWYILCRSLPKLQLHEGDNICMSYRLTTFEPYYPALYFILIDSDGSRWKFEWSTPKLQTEQWYELNIPLSSGQQQNPGDKPGLNDVVRIEIAYNYRWFRQHADYIRWIDNLRFERPVKPEQPVEPGTPSQPQQQQTQPQQQSSAVEPASEPLTFDLNPVEVKPTLFARKAPMLTLDRALDFLHGQTPDVMPQQVGQAHYESFQDWNGTEDFSANLSLFWNEQGLWFGTDVTDDNVVSQSLSQQDFGDCDYWRLYFDMGMESAISGANFDLNDYIFAATPTSSRHKPLINSVNYGGFVHAMHDEDRVFDVNTIGIRSNLSNTGYQLAIHFPSDLLRGFEPRVGKQFAFTCIWGDVDQSGRDCESAWPIPSSADYWRNLANGRDVVLSDDQGGAAWRIKENHINRGKPLVGYITGLYRKIPSDQPQSHFVLTIKAVDQHNNVQGTWQGAMPLNNQAATWGFELDTTKLAGGEYQLLATITGGTWRWEMMPWPVLVNSRQQHEWLADLQQQYEQIKQRYKTAKREVSQLKKTVGAVDYLEPYLAVTGVMDNILRYHFNKEHYTKAQALLVDLQDILETLESKLKHPYRWAGPTWEVHSPLIGQGNMPTIRDGAFMLNDQPVLFTGVMGRPVRTFYPDVIKQVGFNAVSLTQHFWNAVPGKFEDAAWSGEDEKNFTLDTQEFRKQALNVAHVSVSIHAPTDYVRNDPILSQARGHFLPFDIASPRITTLAQAYYKVVYPGMDRTLPDALSYCLLNEPAFEALSPAGVQRYQVWLKQRYDTLASLNKQWQSSYRNFEDIPATRDDSSDAARYDWILFNQSVMTQFASELHELSNAYDPSHKPKHLKLMSHTFRGNSSTVLGGIDELAIAKQFEVIGFDGNLAPVYLDFIRPMAPDKPMYNSESHLRWNDPLFMRSEIFEGAIRGVDAQTLWLWDPPWGAWGRMENYPFQQPRGMLAAGLTSLDLQRLAAPLHAMSRQKARVALLFSQPARVFNYDRYIENLTTMHEALRYSGMPVEVMHEGNLIDRQWGDVKLVIMPSSAYIGADTYDALKQFTANGGQVILVDPDQSWRDPYGKVLPLIKTPQTTVQSIKYLDQQQLFASCNRWLDQAGITSEQIVWPPVRGLSWRSIVVDGKRWIYLNNTTNQQQDVEIKLNLKPVKGMDRILQEPVSSHLTLAAYQIRLIEVH